MWFNREIEDGNGSFQQVLLLHVLLYYVPEPRTDF